MRVHALPGRLVHLQPGAWAPPGVSALGWHEGLRLPELTATAEAERLLSLPSAAAIAS